jgi:hypothetical protein
MGFGKKTDFATGRILDLNKSYKLLIKPVVESKGLMCIRADEILHSGSIDYQMYKELYNADLVIADISTANVNAFYELGIRHALKKRSTIVISEDKYQYPFDLNHVKITSYCHLGDAIDYEEVERFRQVLGETIDTVLKINDPDSPVYSHLPVLKPPILKTEPRQQKNIATEILNNTADDEDDSLISVPKVTKNQTLGYLIEEGEKALHERNYAVAKSLFQSAVVIYNAESNDNSNQDSYLIQRLAFATYKAKLPDYVSSLHESKGLLEKLDLGRTNDTETVSLAGRVEKKLFEKGQGEQHLANAIQFYQRGYFLLHNRYHGINLAYLFNKRVDTSIFNTPEDKIADMVFANRVRRQVLEMCENDWNAITSRKNRIALKSMGGNAAYLSEYDESNEDESMFFIKVNKAECHYALGEMEEYKKALDEAKLLKHERWMVVAFEKQFADLQPVFRKYGHLLNPPWKEK